RGIVIVIIANGFILRCGRLGLRSRGLLSRVLGDHVRETRSCGFGLFSLGLFRFARRRNDVTEAAFELFAQFGLRLRKGRRERSLIRGMAWDKPCKTIRCYRIRFAWELRFRWCFWGGGDTRFGAGRRAGLRA